MSLQPFVFLDLGRTMIESMETPTIINTVYLRPYIKGQRVGIFTFDLNGEEDKRRFEETLKPVIEVAFRIEITKIIGAQDIIDVIEKRTGIKVRNIAELSQIYGKDLCFQMYARTKPLEGVLDYVLLDDCVTNSTHIYHSPSSSNADLRVHLRRVGDQYAQELPGYRADVGQG